MIVLDTREIADLHASLGRVAGSRHTEAEWARARMTALRNGLSLTTDDAARIRVAEAEIGPPRVDDRATPQLCIAQEESDEAMSLTRKQVRKARNWYV